MKHSKKRILGIFAAMMSASIFGCMPLLVKTINAGGSTTLTTIFLRYFLSLPAIYIFLKWRHIPLSITRQEFFKIFILTLFGYGSTPVLLYLSYNYIPSGMATTIHFCYPAFTILGCILFLKEKPKPLKLFCIILSIIGILMFYNGGNSSQSAFTGLLLAFISGLTYSFYVVYLEYSHLQQMHSLKLIFYMHSIGSVGVFFFALATNNFTLCITPLAWTTAFLLAVSVCFIGVFGFQISVKYIGASTTTVLSTFEPITSLVIGIWFFNEVFYLKNLIGCIAILTATILIGQMKE